MESRVEDASTRLSSLSIVVDDVDGRRNRSQGQSRKEESLKIEKKNQTHDHIQPSVQNPYPKHVLEDAIRDILEEAELRKFEFRKLIDEHDALVENLKKMEKENSTTSAFLHSPIMT